MGMALSSICEENLTGKIIIKIECYFFSFLWGMNEKPNCTRLFVCLCCGFMAQSTTRLCRASQLIVVLFLGGLGPSKPLTSTLGSNWQLPLGFNSRNYNISVMFSRLSKDRTLETEERWKIKKKIQPTVPHLLQAQQALALLYAKVAGRPGTHLYDGLCLPYRVQLGFSFIPQRNEKKVTINSFKNTVERKVKIKTVVTGGLFYALTWYTWQTARHFVAKPFKKQQLSKRSHTWAVHLIPHTCQLFENFMGRKRENDHFELTF